MLGLRRVTARVPLPAGELRAASALSWQLQARADRGRACERVGAYPKILLSSPLPSMYKSSESRKSSMDGTGARDPALACSGWYAVTSSFDETR